MTNFITNIRKKHLFFILYLFALHGILFSIIFYPNLAHRLATKLKLAPKNEFVIKYKASMNTMHYRVDQNTRTNSVIFIGDSLVQALSVSSVHPIAVNFGIGHDTINGVSNRSSTYKSVITASSVIISVGINDLRRNSVNYALNDYKNLLYKLKLIPNIYIHEVLPIDSNILGKELQSKITEFNQRLFKLSKDFDNIHFLKSSNDFFNSDGDLNTYLHIGDGLHLNKQGYNVWINQLQKQIKNQ